MILELPNDIGAIEKAVEHAVACCAHARLDRRRLLFNFRVGLTEALSNAMLYGNRNEPGGRVRVELHVLPGEVRASVSDQGRGFDPDRVPDPRLPANLLRPDGRGVFLMRALMDEVHFNPAGNAVTLVLRDPDGGDRDADTPAPTGEDARAAGAARPDIRLPGHDADDHVTRILAATIARSAELARQAETTRADLEAALEANRRLREEMAREHASREMQLAHDLQLKLLPPIPRMKGVEAAARVVPAASVGGDFYQVIQLSGGRVGVMIGDVSGHGFPAALIMALVMSAATIYAEEGRAPAAVLEYLNRAIGDELESTEMYLSLCYCVLAPGRSGIAYSNTGHPHAFVVQADGTARRLFATDPPMGIGPTPYGESNLRWRPGEDLLLLFTDGLSDTLARSHRSTGEERVLDTVAANRHRPVSEILDTLFAMSRDAVPSIPADDRTAVILRTS
ncbi:MAG: SpoIIE family protein phosphatase [Gemmatimonadota bacterium]|nr:SpoIIE family protein phosphatase [Gemmatimonadota bacterium]